MKWLLRVLALAGFIAFITIWLAAATAALAVPFTLAGAVVTVAILVLSRSFRALQLAALVGLIWIWRLPVLVAVLLAVPRIVLILPGLVATWLAGRRHPRLRWS
ncbi:MAG TPA: hypothetical protein VHZ99_04905 [Steroidobacteraceae bacterium]|jgi:hypothetical protein|nr:hypothetical protein [Steroidobacteraceae bacterium]